MGDEEGQNKAEILKTQLTEGLHNVSKEDVVKMIVAYEPIWAIGTGNNCSPEETKSAVAVIKNTITDLYDADTANVMQVLYGGSVNSQNSVSYLKEAGVDGLLVGGASLKPEEFIAIVTSAQ
jgi:triosephosphate isomerase